MAAPFLIMSFYANEVQTQFSQTCRFTTSRYGGTQTQICQLAWMLEHYLLRCHSPGVVQSLFTGSWVTFNGGLTPTAAAAKKLCSGSEFVLFAAECTSGFITSRQIAHISKRLTTKICHRHIYSAEIQLRLATGYFLVWFDLNPEITTFHPQTTSKWNMADKSNSDIWFILPSSYHDGILSGFSTLFYLHVVEIQEATRVKADIRVLLRVLPHYSLF